MTRMPDMLDPSELRHSTTLDPDLREELDSLAEEQARLVELREWLATREPRPGARFFLRCVLEDLGFVSPR